VSVERAADVKWDDDSDSTPGAAGSAGVGGAAAVAAALAAAAAVALAAVAVAAAAAVDELRRLACATPVLLLLAACDALRPLAGAAFGLLDAADAVFEPLQNFALGTKCLFTTHYKRTM